MSRIRPWTNGDQVPLENSKVPVVLYDANNVPIQLEANGGMPVNIQDQTTPAIIFPANQLIAKSTLTATVTLDTNTCTIADSTGMSIGDMFVVTSQVADRVIWGWITNIVGTTPATITTSVYWDYAYESGEEFSACTDDLAVDGSSTRQIFSLRATEPSGGIGLTVDVTRLIFQMETATAPEITDFGDIAGGITNGLLCRKTDGTYFNVFNFRSNSELQSLCFDLQLYSTLGVADNGLSARLTFGGQDKIGVVQRIGELEDLEFIVSDNLSSLTKFRVMIQGHVVTGVGA